MFQAIAIPSHIYCHPASQAGRPVSVKPTFEVRCSQSVDPRILRTLDFCETGPTYLISLDAAAIFVCLSTSRLRHLFKQHLGISFHQYLITLQMSKARVLIHNTDHSIAHIARLVGRSDASHFTRDFKRAYGLTPGAARSRGWAHRKAKLANMPPPDPLTSFVPQVGYNAENTAQF